MKTDLEIETEHDAAELRQVLFDALGALMDPDVMERVSKFRAKNPQFLYEPSILAATAVNERRSLEEERAAALAAPPLPADKSGAQPPGESEGKANSLALPPSGY